MLIPILIVAAAIFVGYAVYSHYNITPVTDSVPSRVWASVVAAGMAAGAALMSWLHGVTAP